MLLLLPQPTGCCPITQLSCSCRTVVSYTLWCYDVTSSHMSPDVIYNDMTSHTHFLLCDLDLWPCPSNVHHQGQSPCQILWPYIKWFSCEGASRHTDWQINWTVTISLTANAWGKNVSHWSRRATSIIVISGKKIWIDLCWVYCDLCEYLPWYPIPLYYFS